MRRTAAKWFPKPCVTDCESLDPAYLIKAVALPFRAMTEQPPTAKPSHVMRAMFAGAVVFIVAAVALSHHGGSASPGEASPGGLQTVVYDVGGSASGADVTYTDGSGGISQQSGLAVPLTDKATGHRGGIEVLMHSGDFASISAQNDDGWGSVVCSISVGGIVLKTVRSSGGYAIADCSTTIP